MIKYNFMTEYLTPEGLEKLKKELAHLEKAGRSEAAEKLKHAVSFGDLSENAAYDEARESQNLLESKISELKGIISSAKIIEKNQTGKVRIGSAVSVFCLGKKEEYQIVGSEEVDVLKGKISNQSPLGRALLGKAKGEKALLKIADGQVEYKILEIN